VCKHGLRYVRPYHFDFVCNVKRRQAGQRLVDLFAREFPQRPREVHRRPSSTLPLHHPRSSALCEGRTVMYPGTTRVSVGAARREFSGVH
jgi:hypothetical protein